MKQLIFFLFIFSNCNEKIYQKPIIKSSYVFLIDSKRRELAVDYSWLNYIVKEGSNETLRNKLANHQSLLTQKQYNEILAFGYPYSFEINNELKDFEIEKALDTLIKGNNIMFKNVNHRNVGQIIKYIFNNKNMYLVFHDNHGSHRIYKIEDYKG